MARRPAFRAARRLPLQTGRSPHRAVGRLTGSCCGPLGWCRIRGKGDWDACDVFRLQLVHRSAVDALGNNLLAGSMRMAWSDMAHSARFRFTYSTLQAVPDLLSSSQPSGTIKIFELQHPS